jgi:hypothetical protein
MAVRMQSLALRAASSISDGGRAMAQADMLNDTTKAIAAGTTKVVAIQGLYEIDRSR